MASKYYYAVPWRERFLFLKLISKWKGSVWQLLWIDLLIYLLLSTSLSLLYRLLLSKDDYYPLRVKFEEYVEYLKTVHNVVPLSFLLGFFVSLIVARWWAVCMYIPWMNHSSILVPSYLANCIPNGEGETRQIRYLIMRYMNLSIAINLRSVSSQLQRRFAIKTHNVFNQMSKEVGKVTRLITLKGEKESKVTTRDKLEVFNKDAAVRKTFGFLITEDEIQTFEQIADNQGSKYEPEYWIPLQWALRVVQKARETGYIQHDRHYVQMTQLIEDLRDLMHKLWLYFNFNIPLVYVQVVIIAVYSFVFGDMVAHQFVRPLELNSTQLRGDIQPGYGKVDLYVPVFAILKFIFYVGWFKIGYGLLNPLGEDSDDFPVSEIFSYNLEVSVCSGSAKDFLYPSFLSESKPTAESDIFDALPKAESKFQSKHKETIIEGEDTNDTNQNKDFPTEPLFN